MTSGRVFKHQHHRSWIFGLTLALALALVTPLLGDAAQAAPEGEPIAAEEPAILRLRLPDSDAFSYLREEVGLDVDDPSTGPGGTVEVQAILTPSEEALAVAHGAEVLSRAAAPTLESLQQQFFGNVEVEPQRPETPEDRGRGRGTGGDDGPVVEEGDLQVLRADWFSNYSGEFLYLEVRSAGGSATNTVTVDEPSAAAGSYDATGAAFGPTLAGAALPGDIVLVDDGSASPTEGCNPLVGFPAGAIALVDRGSCNFTLKVANAQAAGAVAVIVANNTGGAPIDLGGSDPSITIPSGMVSQADGAEIKAGLPATGSFKGNAIVARFEEGGVERTETLSPFVDAGVYMYHRFGSPVPLDEVPETVTISGGDAEVEVSPTEWLPGSAVDYPDGYEWGFVNSGYMDAVQTTERIESLAGEFPDLAELVDLPHDTHGYRRQAQAFLGTLTSNAFYVLTDAYGHEGGNDYTLEVVDPGVANADLDVELDGTTVRVSVATDGDGDTDSTAAEVVAALNDDPDVSAIGTAYTYRGNSGGAPVITGTVQFSDGLDAPAHVPRAPFDMKAIRIGSDRSGDNVGVLVYCQEHAREWVTPLVCLETVERLLRNYGSDPTTTTLVDSLDIFVIPTVNPDGTNYSMYDYNFQRRNMANYCEPSQSDSLRWDAFGVDLNRNFRIGSIHDGYSGASSSCTSDVFSGPSEASEPEARNELWIVEEFENIRFSMNTHSHGGYFMWAPGAYQLPGRIPLPRPSLGVEDYFWEASEHILTRIKEYRGTVIMPGRTGPVIDVLYSAAGNSADDHYYFDEETRDPEIFAWNFEVGAQVWTGSFWSSPGFQPDFETEGFHQAMEFSDGMTGLLEVARAFATDTQAPSSSVNVSNGGWYSGPVDVVFDTDEPATIYYTTDGSRPDWDSPTIEQRDVRDVAEPLRISETTTIRWFAADMAGNVEGGYDPDGRGHNYQRVHVRIVPD